MTEQRALLGVGLMLHRAPTPLRTPAFARAVEEWLAAGDTAPVPRVSLAAALPPPPEELGAPQARPPAAAPHHEERTLTSGTRPLPAPRAQADQPMDTMGPWAVAASVPTPADNAAPMLPVQNAAAEEVAPEGALPAVDSAPLSAGGAPWPEEATLGHSGPLVEARVETAFGGLFYLLNVALALELYGDFTMPAHPGIALPVWDFLALAGLDLLGPPLRDDPVWDLLGRLAGRPREHAPGHDFAPPDDWRLPPEWLAPFPAPAALRWAASGGRLRVVHAAGFPLLDIARSGEARQLPDELRVYGLGAARAAGEPSPPREPASALERWLGCLMAYVRARLRLALGEHEDAATSQLVCAHRASVRISAARVDVALSLAELPIAIRLAGLDRDPGWIPAAGRAVAFHFE